MRYCGVVPVRGSLQLAMLEEVRSPEPPIELSAIFFEPGSAAQVAAELRSLDEIVLGVAAPLTGALREQRDCDVQLATLGVAPLTPDAEAARLVELLPEHAVFAPASGERDGGVGDDAYRECPVFETNQDGVFSALLGRRLPARRHPFGLSVRIEELQGDRVNDDGGDLWHRRVEELDAVACALCAHRYALGHASWLGDPAEGVVVLPGSSVPHELPALGVMPAVERLRLPPVTGA